MNWMEFIVELAKPIALALVTLIVGWGVINALVNLIKRQIGKSKLDESLKPFIVSVIGILLKLLLAVSVVGILGIPTASFVAVLGSFGLALGLAFQGSLSNLAGGVLLLTMRPFKVGDYIEGAGYDGTVKAIQILYTELVTPDNNVIYIPNGTSSNSGIVNYSVNDTRRVDLVFGVGYETDNQHVIQTLKRIITKHPAIILDPEPFIRLTGHGDSAVEYTVRAWTKAEDYWTVRFDLMEEVKTTFDEENISIPYPQMDVHMNQ
ncbi:MAG: mechanosensitive ion channel [Alkalibacterium sp.]|nr:mechanosensitive ion channel [Alkalibacterium sp.]